jgi:hypothetical protein
MSFFTTSFRVPFPKAQLKEDNDEQIRNLLDTGIYPARLITTERLQSLRLFSTLLGITLTILAVPAAGLSSLRQYIGSLWPVDSN